MKFFFLLAAIVHFSVSSFSQSLSQIEISSGISLSSYSFFTDQQVIIKISPEGKIMEWGTALEPTRYNYQPGKLQPYMGRVDYYGIEADSAYRNKVKSIGTARITYYSSFDDKVQTGKVKSIGSTVLDYYSTYENKAFSGKLKSAGAIILSYYGSFDNEALREKLKSVGNTSLTYYSSLDDKLLKGKIKSIGTASYSWYSSFDQKEYRGALKSGSLLQKINGINYIIW
jgi:hypothetical protein